MKGNPVTHSQRTHPERPFLRAFVIHCCLLLALYFTPAPLWAQSTPQPGPVNLIGSVTGAGTTDQPNTGPAAGFVVHEFLANGTFTVPLPQVQVLAVGGGGGGGAGGASAVGAGGGGAGRYVQSAVTITPSQAVTVGIGTGGSGGSGGGRGTNGGATTLTQGVALLSMPGGGGGGGANNLAGLAGGSGGGGAGGTSNNTTNGSGGTASGPVGSLGESGGTGLGRTPSQHRAGGGGGGSAGAGQASPSNGTAGAGGDGTVSTWFGDTFAAGGGGGANTPGDGGSSGVGGAGSGNAAGGTPPGANSGSGGGGSKSNNDGGAGSAGIVRVRYLAPTLTVDVNAPASIAPATVFDTPMRVRIMSGDNTPQPVAGVPVTVSFEFQSDVGATLGGTTVVNTDANGYATFTNLTVSGAPGTYQFRFAVAGAAGNFVVSNTTTLQEPAYFRITHSTGYGLCTAFTEVTVSLVELIDGNEVPIDDYTGTVTISNTGGSGAQGSYTAPNGNGTLTPVSPGVVTYQFDDLDDGQVTLRFVATGADTLTFDANDSVNGFSTEDYNLQMEVGNCTIGISHSGLGGTCAATPVTFAILAPGGVPALGYTGTITVTTAPAVGNWSAGFGGDGSFANGTPNDGIATYTFDADDGGSITLGFQAVAGNYTFSASATAGVGGVSANDGNLQLVADCQFRITLPANTGSTCTPSTVVLSITDNSGNVITGFTGNVSLSTQGVTGGNWSKTNDPADAFGALTPGAPDTGAAVYQFLPDDQGQVTLYFSNQTQETVNFNVFAPGVAQPSGSFDPNLQFQGCQFRIVHSQASDVCSIAEIQIYLVDHLGDPVLDYEGEVTLSTSTGFGGWFDIGQSDGTLDDPVLTDGTAVYQFVASDEGNITLGFRHATNTGPVNINVTDYVNFDAQNASNQFDRNLVISNCTVEIVHDNAGNACSVAEVQFTVRNSLGQIAEDYQGTLRISNNTDRGDWANVSGQGSLTAPAGPDAGVADYTFVPGLAGDAGVVTLGFTTQTPGSINFDVEDGVIIESGSADPNLALTGCFPGIVAGPVCTDPGSSANISIPAQASNPALRGRLLLMATMQVGASTTNTGATFDSEPMTRLRREYNADASGVTVELWAMLDADLPDAAGTYTGTFTDGTAGSAICLLVVNGVEQVLPVATAQPEQGPLNSSQYTGAVEDLGNGLFHTSSTTVSTNENNAFIMSVVANNDFARANNAAFFRPTQPSITFDDVWSAPQPTGGFFTQYNSTGLMRNNVGNIAANPTGGRSAGSAGVQAALGVVEVNEFYQYNPDQTIFPAPSVNSHVVAVFNPLVPGDPLANNYDPVILYKTYAGRLSYRSIGNSLRTLPSEPTQTAADCSFVPFNQGNAATLTLPAGSTVVDAYLYWGGSGGVAQADSVVTFGPTNSEVEVVATETFSVVGVTAQNVDFFAAYANVKDLIAGNGSYTFRDLEVVDDGLYASNATCAGGWNLVVIYDNPNERLRVVNLFHGFQPFQWSAFTLVPRNFRMATYDAANRLPNGQVTHFTIEGDEQLANGDESLGIQTAPNSTSFTGLPNSFNPVNAEFNSTVTRPIYILQDGFYQFNDGGGPNNDGYEIDFSIPPALVGPNRIGGTYGIDIDTHYLAHFPLLEPFAQPGQEAERITTRYSTGQDIVMLVNEVISITNYPLADIEVFISASGNFKVGSTGTYFVEVRNNGNGTPTDGDATGVITATLRLPPGLTIANSSAVTAPGWTCSVQTAPAAGALTCEVDLSLNPLVSGDSLPIIEVVANIAEPPTQFLLQTNPAKATARVLHSGGNCAAQPIGFLSTLDECDRSPQFDNRFDLQGGAIDINDLENKTDSNNNVDSVITNVLGRLTNLRMQKSVVDVLETQQQAQYLLTVTNLGPDATTSPFVVTDSLPSSLGYISAAGNLADAANWNCNFSSPTVTCTYSGTLASNTSTSVLLTVDVLGAAGINVVNTATVTEGQYNFDTVQANNVVTDITTIVGPPAAGQERFLLSVSDVSNSTSISNLSNFENHDLIIYDPLTDEAEMFFDNSALGYGVVDINAAHLLKNGHIIMSAAAASTVGTNNLPFDPWDLVRYDPILGIAHEFLDGSLVFADHENVNINAVYVMDDCDAGVNQNRNCSILLSTTTGGTAGSNNLDFTASDIIRFYRSGPQSGTAEIYIDGSDADVFGTDEGSGNVNIDAFYVRVDPASATDVVDRFALSVDNENALIGEGLTPITGTPFTRDDVVLLDLESVTPETELLFDGAAEPGVFTATSALRRLDALHIVEDGYTGHFSIREVQAGNVCTPTLVQISKHEGLTHARDTDYYGTIRLSTSTGQGVWQSVQTGSGQLANIGGANDGQAIYTFVPGDQGRVVLRLVHDQPSTVNVNVTNGIARELASEDPNFAFDEVLTAITFIDDFGNSAFNNNVGTRNFAAPWSEVDGVTGPGTGVGAGSGNILINAGRLRMTSSVQAVNNGIQPTLTRRLNLDPNDLPYTEDVIMRLFYGHNTLSVNDTLLVEVRGSENDAWLTLFTFTNINTNNENSSIELVLNMTDRLAQDNQDFTDTTEIRFRITNGYELERYFYINEVRIETATNECGFSATGDLDHYQIQHPGVGLQCIGTPITITAHDSVGDPFNPEESILLSTASGRGVWSRILAGTGSLTPLASQTDNGQATYTFPPGESSVTLLLNYTIPANNPSPVDINIEGATSGATELQQPDHDPQLVVQDAGLVFYNETLAQSVIPTQIAGKPSTVDPLGHILTLMAVRSADNDPLQCVPLFDDGQVLEVELAAECKDPSVCAAAILEPGNPEVFTINSEPVVLANDNSTVGASTYTPFELTFTTQGSGFPAATLELNYSDIGLMQLHARYDIPFGFFGDTNPVDASPITPDDPLLAPRSGDYLTGSSNEFVVRPFALAIDFAGDIGLDRAEDYPVGNFPVGNSLAVDESGSAWQVAGDGFDVMVSAVAWQAEDDVDNDGQPDAGANLNNNRRTASIYRDIDGLGNNYRVELSVTSNQAQDDGGVLGALSDDTLFRNEFENSGVTGFGRLNTSYNEVGIIDLAAALVDAVGDPFEYLGTETIVGFVQNVGRFYPARFDVTSRSLWPRVNSCMMVESDFTYMGEEFEISVELTAVNRQGVITQNYRAGFANLSSVTQMDFRAIEPVDAADNVDRTDRLENATVPANLQPLWSADVAGVLQLVGNLVFNRDDPAVPDGPFPDMNITLLPVDSDGVTLDSSEITVELVLNDPTFALLAEHDFRYGRLLINNAYGPETEDLAITFRVEYFDGERFILNVDDSCTIIEADELSFVGTTYTGDLEAGDTTIVTPQTSTFFNGQIQGVQSAANPTDATFTLTAPGEGNSGRVDIELDLDVLNLQFLQFRWPHEDNDYDENPRAQVEFGQFRSHDRVINWQEIYNGPTPTP